MPPSSPSTNSRIAERDLLDDAAVLIHRYKSRNRGDTALTAEQRKVWAEQVVAVVERLRHALAAEIGPPDAREEHERKRIWLEQFMVGLRIPKALPQDPPDLRPPEVPSWKRAFDRDAR